MVYGRKLLFILLIIALSGVFLFEIAQKKVQQKADNFIFKEFANQLNDSFEINEYIDHISYDDFDSSIIFNLQFNKKFSELPVYNQFSVLYTYCKHLRFHIMNYDEKRFLLNRNIYLMGNYNDLTFQFDYVTQREGLTSFKPKAVLSINGKPVYEERQYITLTKNLGCNMETNYINGHSDKEIMEYASRIFNLITNYGSDVEIERDFDVVLNEVIDKFTITFEDYSRIYKKYYFCVCY